MPAHVYLALLHTPVVNRKGDLVTTSVTNMDIHDISRSARTFEIKGYFIVTPLEDQTELVGRILDHWRSEKSKTYHPDRAEAFSIIHLAKSFDEVKNAVAKAEGELPEVVLTDARPHDLNVSYADYRRELESDQKVGKPVVLVFGTGWGVAESFFPEVHRFLAPVYGPKGNGGYNHLSVRAAAGIILDRLFGL